MRYSISDTAEYGDYTAGSRIVTAETKATMRQLLKEIQSGEFAKKWIAENETGLPNFKAMRERDRNHPIEVVGVEAARHDAVPRSGEAAAAGDGLAMVGGSASRSRPYQSCSAYLARLARSGPGMSMNKYSSRVTQPRSQGASQAMLYGIGLTDADLQKPQVGICSMWYEGNTCNMHLDRLAAHVKEGVQAAGLVGLRFNTIGVSDGLSMGTDGMSYSLPSRDLIADSIETVMGAQWYDALVTVPGLRQEHARVASSRWRG